MNYQRRLDKDFAKTLSAIRAKRVIAATVLGVDPGDGCLRGLAVVREDGSTFLLGIHWKDGMINSEPLGGPIGSRSGAIRMMYDERDRLLAHYTWFIPGTEEPVPGCWTSYRRSGGEKHSDRRAETRINSTNGAAED